MVVICLQNHVLAHHLKVVEVRSACGGASPAMALAAGPSGLAKKCVWNILVLGLVGLQEEGTAPPALPQELCVCDEGRGLDDVRLGSGLDCPWRMHREQG